MSKKLGRPLATPEPRDNSVTIRLNSKELKNLEDWCWRYDLSISDCLRDSLMILGVIPDDLPFRKT